MKPLLRSLLSLAAISALSALCYGADRPAVSNAVTPATPIYIAFNQDLGFPSPNSVGFFLAQGTQVTFQNAVDTGGYGIQGGFFGTSRLASIASLSAPCLYVSNSSSNDVASLSLQSHQLVGNFPGSKTDDGSSNGIGLAVNANYLYASFSTSKTVGTFALTSGCGLSFLGDISASGLQGGSISGMAVNGKTLVVAYGDGSIESFNVANGTPVSNNDRQNSTGYTGGVVIGGAPSPGNIPSGVDMTQDGKFAIFGDISSVATVEVSSLASGKLAKTTAYTVGSGVDAGTIRLSPDESLLYISNNEGGTVTAAFFDAGTGNITRGCTSATLSGFNGRPWLGSVVTRDTTGTGNVLYVAEFGRDYLEIDHGPASALGILDVTSNGTSCTLRETRTSPVTMYLPGVLSIGVYPPRPF